jgi:succinate dehydrogenase flavin-adding protein (antitoxin of CptAB toxin-antitoxin module)
MPNAAARLGRLRWRSRRGVLELDLMLAAFLDAFESGLGEDELCALEALLAKEDDELSRLLIGGAKDDSEEIDKLAAQIRKTGGG